MKKFLPYIFITAFIGAFLMISFSPSFSGTFSEPKVAYAQQDDTQSDKKEVYGADAIKESLDGSKETDTWAWGWTKKIADFSFGNMLKWISASTVFFARLIFNASAYLMDLTIDLCIKDFAINIEGVGIVDQGYGIILNVANMIFIFLLLYIAIKTILGEGGDTKQLLTRIIIVALMINFSLFMTKAIIDATNILAMGFYRGIRTEIKTSEGTMIAVGSISTSMMNGLRLSSLLPSKSSKFVNGDKSKGYSNLTIAIVNFGSTTLLLIAAFVFFSISFLFILRFVTLLFYMMFSPVAFLGYISPHLSDYSKKWWTGLLSQAQFAPIFMLTMFLISSMINSGGLLKITGEGLFYDDLASGFVLGFSSILNFVILIALMLAALITAKKGAETGSSVGFEYAEKFRGWTQGMMGRNVVGRPSEYANKGLDTAKEYLEERRWGRVLLGATKYGSLGLAGGARDLIKKGETTKFGSGQSRKDITEERTEDILKGIKDRRNNPERMATYLAGLWGKERKNAYDKMSARDRAAIEEAWNKTHATAPQKTKDLFKDLREKLSIEEKEKTEKASGDAKKSAENRARRTDIENFFKSPPVIAMNTSVTPNVPYTLPELINRLPEKEAHKLPPGILLNPRVIPLLSNGHIANITTEGVLEPQQRIAMRRLMTLSQEDFFTHNPNMDSLWS